jgi:hypothetical protein
MLHCRLTKAATWLALLVFALPLVLTGCNDLAASSMPRDATPAVQQPEANKAPAAPRQPLRPGAKTKVLARAGDRPYDKTFDHLRFDIQPGDPFHKSMLPEQITSMDGQRIRIRGFILPTAQKRGIKTFVLVRDNQECCFGPGAALYDCILVVMQPGNTAEFSIRPVAVDGTFSINEVLGPDGKHLAIYRLDAESVQ